MGRLENKVAIVTGAGQGIGRGIAHRFAREGAKLVLAEWKAHRGERVQKELAELGAEAIAIPTDVSERSQLDRMVEEEPARAAHLYRVLAECLAQYLTECRPSS